MSVSVNTKWSSGYLGNKHPDGGSCVGVAGEGLPSAFYYVHGKLTIEVDDDGAVWLNQTSLTVEQNDISNVGGGGWGADTWTFHGLYISKDQFTLYDGPGGPSGYGEGVQVWSSGHISHDMAGLPTSHYSWLSSGSSNGRKKIANSIQDLIKHGNVNEDYTEIYFYAGGLIDFSSTPTTSISVKAAKIVLTSEDGFIADLFDYFPWQRRLSSKWYSLDRDGTSQNVTGLYRKVNSSWRKCTNTLSSGTSNDHGFVYNNGWQKSPRSGLME